LHIRRGRRGGRWRGGAARRPYRHQKAIRVIITNDCAGFQTGPYGQGTLFVCKSIDHSSTRIPSGCEKFFAWGAASRGLHAMPYKLNIYIAKILYRPGAFGNTSFVAYGSEIQTDEICVKNLAGFQEILNFHGYTIALAIHSFNFVLT
jgi:hypothetical protein